MYKFINNYKKKIQKIKIKSFIRILKVNFDILFYIVKNLLFLIIV